MADPTRAALAAAWAVSQIGSQDWNNYCELLAEQAYGTRGQYPTAAAAGSALITHQPRPVGNPLDGAQPGDLLFFRADAANGQAGHAGIYLGGDEMVSATPTGVKRTPILTDPYYGPRFAGWGPAPDSWQGPASTPQLVQGAADLIAAAHGASGGPPAAGKDTPVPPPSDLPKSAKQIALEQQLAAAQGDLTRATTDLETARANRLGMQRERAHAREGVDVPDDQDMKNADEAVAEALRRATQATSTIKSREVEIADERDQQAAAQARADAAANKTPPASSQYLNTDASDQFIIARNPDGTIKMKPDGSGPETIRNPNYRPPAATTAATKAQEPKFFTRADGSVIITDADGSNPRVLLASDKVPGTMTDPSTGDVYLQGPDGKPSGPPIFAGKPPIATSTNNGIATGVNTQTGEQVWQDDLRTPVQKAKDALDQEQAQYEASRSVFIKGLDTPENHAAHPNDFAVWAKAQLDTFDAPHLSRAQALQEQQEQRLAAAAKEQQRQFEAQQQAQAARDAEAARHDQEAEQQNRATIAQRAGEAATVAETARQKVLFPAAQAAPALQPIYDAFSGGKFPSGAAFSPTVFPHRDSPQDVGQRVFEAVMQRLAPVSPLVQQHAQYAPDQGNGQQAGPGLPGVPGSTTQSTMGAPAQASLLNAITASGALPPPGQQSGLPLAPAAYGGVAGVAGAIDPAATLPPAQAGQPINPWRYPGAYQ